MNKLEITELGARLIAVFNLTTIVSTLPALIAAIEISSTSGSGYPYSVWTSGFFSIIMPALVSLFLWFKAKSISIWMWRNSQTGEAEPSSPTTTQIQVVIFTSIGLYFLLSSIPELLKFSVYVGQRLLSNSFVGLYDYSFVVGYTIQMLLSIWLILGSNRLVNALQNRQRNLSK